MSLDLDSNIVKNFTKGIYAAPQTSNNLRVRYNQLDTLGQQGITVEGDSGVFTDNVINKISSKYNLEIVDYTVAPVFMQKNKKGAHQWFIEFKNNPPKNINVAEIIDKELKSENSDYDAKRYNNFTLKRPEIIVSKKGVFMKWLEMNNKIGGQNKIPRLSNERKFIDSLIELNC